MISLLLAIASAVNLTSPSWKQPYMIWDLKWETEHSYLYEPELYTYFFPVPEPYSYSQVDLGFLGVSFPYWPVEFQLPDETTMSIDKIKDVKSITIKSSIKPRIKKDGDHWVISYK